MIYEAEIEDFPELQNSHIHRRKQQLHTVSHTEVRR